MKIRVPAASTTVLGIASTFVFSQALAQPTAYPQKDRSLNVRNTTTSTLLSDTQDSTLAWVLPPSAGTATPTDFRAGNANIGFCQEMALLQDASRDFVQEMADLQMRSEEFLPEIKLKQAEYYSLKKEAESLYASNSDVQRIVDLEDKAESLEKRLDKLFDRADKCGDPDSKACLSIDKEIKDVRKEKSQLREELSELRDTTRDEYLRYKRASSKADVAMDDWKEANKSLKKIRDSFLEARTQFFSMYAQLGKLSGGFANITYDLNWDKNVAGLRTLNPNMRFEKIPTSNVRFNVGFPAGSSSRDSYLASLPSILGYTVNGKSFLPWGNKNSFSANALPDQSIMTLNLSLVGACPLVKPELFDLPKSATGVPVLGVAASYDFPSAYRMNVKAFYNLYKFYELIKKSTTKSGFFDSRSSTSITEKPLEKETFYINWSEEDPKNKTPASERQKVESQLKADLMARALKLMATPVFDGKAAPEAAPPVPERGAVVMAKGLDETCGWYSYYCTGGAWLLRGLDAAFGSSQQESSFKKEHNVTVEEQYSTDSPTLRPGFAVFTNR